MRQMAAAALAALYQPDNISPLSIFTDRFKARFAELIYDVDEMVAVQGVNPSPAPPSFPSGQPCCMSHTSHPSPHSSILVISLG